MSGTDVLGSYWTVAGPVEIGTGREWSLFDWPDRCAQAARVGLTGLGLWHADLEHLLEERTLGEIRSIFVDSGLRDLEVEFLNDWFVEPGDPRRTASDAQRDLLFTAAVELGAHHIKLGNLRRTEASMAQLTDGFAAMCADAADRGVPPLAYELMPFDVNAPSIAGVCEIVSASDPAQGGIAIDTWHLGKLGITPGDLAAIPPERLTFVELSDGQVANMPDHSRETTRHRRLPGEGEFDITGYVAALRGLGYRGPWGVEVLSDALRALPVEEIFRRTADTTSAALAAPVAAEGA
ncbi:sugar phosphate isomerase/epimerase [Pseudonocardia sp. N23]|uniref:sugar phosphate isomerase/epimerase family protein n=1 Tax=Pseudonocardia sp. N23 TaxID=1987376 RepID=UPI000BFE4C2F|nr:sugar phosphate isomerase/epimerase [Pseudonocardia sp. N23]GAY11525.1 4-hydroxyphenylpyruvate dioxygenase [Pseudonocardia sp. N23]